MPNSPSVAGLTSVSQPPLLLNLALPQKIEQRARRSSMRHAQQLLLRIQRRYQTVIETVRLPGLEFPFVRIADPDRVLDEVAEAEDRHQRLSGTRAASDQLHLPYWAELWDSALG